MEACLPSSRALPRLLRSALALCALVAFAAVPAGCGGGDTTDAPAVTSAPAPQSVVAGQSAVFEVAASGAELQYQWRRDGVAIADAVAARYTLAQAQATDHGHAFSVTVRNAGGSVTTAEARLSVLAITAAPQPTEVIAGQPARFTVATTGDGVSLQWQRDGVDVAGATQATLTLDPAQPTDDQSQWTVKVSNAAGSLVSSPVRLGVKPTPPGILELVVGDPGGPGNLDGIGTAARFSFITGLAFDAAGSLWVVDGEYKVLRQLRPDGQVLTVVGEAGSTQMVDGPAAVARFVSVTQLVWSAGPPVPALYVLDAGRLRRVDADGHVTTITAAEVGYVDGPLATARFRSLSALAAHPDGSLYVSEYRDCAVRKIDLRSGQVSTLARAPVCDPDYSVPPALGGITALAVDGQGRINALTSGVVLRIDAAGQVTLPAVFDRGLPYPYNVTGSRLAVDAAGRVHFFVAGASWDTGHYQGLLEDGSLAPSVTTVAANADADWSPFVITPAGRIVHADSGFISLRADGAGQPSTVLAGAAVDPSRAVVGPIAVEGDGSLLRFVAATGRFGALHRRTPAGTEEVIELQQASTDDLSELISDGQGGAYALRHELGFCTLGCSLWSSHIDHMASSGQVRRVAGWPQAGELHGFEIPRGLTLAPNGDLFVVTPGRIRRVTSAGNVSTFASVTTVDDGGPIYGEVLAADRDGNVYFSSRYGHPEIIKFTPQGQSSVFHDPKPATGLEAQLLGVSGLAVAANGDLLVSRCGTSGVDRITAAGETRTVVGVRDSRGIRTGSLPGSLYCPSKLNWDDRGSLYIQTPYALLKARFSP